MAIAIAINAHTIPIHYATSICYHKVAVNGMQLTASYIEICSIDKFANIKFGAY